MTARHHHFLSQCYLRGFTKGNSKKSKLTVIDLLQNKHFETKPRNVGGLRDFNRIDVEGVDPIFLEKSLAEFEGEAARALKRRVYGNRIVLFAPLYVGNQCTNDCQYCAFRKSNKNVTRRTLSAEDLEEQITALEAKGHKRLILVFGEHPRYSADFIAETVRRAYRVKQGHVEIRRVNITIRVSFCVC